VPQNVYLPKNRRRLNCERGYRALARREVETELAVR